MKIFKTRTRKIISLIIIITFVLNTVVFANSYNPSRQEIESMIDEVSMKRAIPSVLMKAIARIESTYEQFNKDGSPKITGDCIGLMMINNRNGGYDSQRLKYDIEYNIEAGADVLLNKWSMSAYKSVSSVGDMNPDVLENWYFALWAYNGWAQSNNPNSLPSYVKKYTYQQLVYNICKDEYNQNINNIDFSYLPKSGKPSRSLVVPTPSNINSGGIVLYEIGDFVRTDGVRKAYHLRDVPSGKYIFELPENQLGTITEGPILKNGYYWYKFYINDYKQGWIERNYLTRTGDIENGRYIFDDISFHWARKDIMKLYKKGIIGESTSFNPDEYITHEGFSIFLSKTLNKISQNETQTIETTDVAGPAEDMNKTTKLPFLDVNMISPWALEYVEDMYNSGLIKNYVDYFRPQDKMTRKEAALILSNALSNDNKYDSLDINSIFSDIGELSLDEVNAIKNVYTNGIMSGKNAGQFHPNDYLTRAETAAMMVKLSDKLGN
nr:S-layer homology domain-containing protein [Sedimentibacter sp.]